MDSAGPSSPSQSSHGEISPPPTPLGPLSALPPHLDGLKRLRILLLVTSINSFTQRILSYLDYLGFEHVSVQLAVSDAEMLKAAEAWNTDIVLCPFLTKKLSESIHTRWITLIVHPGPPGDAGPSSLDWVLLGDDGSTPDSTTALSQLLLQSSASSAEELAQRSHWGTICFQATEQLDGGAVWAWEQYALPPLGSITKAQLYQGYHSFAATSAVIHALCRVYEQTIGVGLSRSDWLKALPREEWSSKCVSLGQSFLGGPTHDRPLLQATKRRPDWSTHSARDVLRILNASDSQPGAMLNPLTDASKSSLFAYGGHVHENPDTIPAQLYTSLGYNTLASVPNGKILATRQGAVFIKTHWPKGEEANAGAGLWITHGRVPRGKDKPIDPKIPMAEAIRAAGHGSTLEGVCEWEQKTWEEKQGEWQDVYVRSVHEGEGIAQLVYWNFYNGAFTTENCKTLLKALQWATEEARGNVKLLVLMGGNYFSNGIALNTIEHASSPGMETWNNINAIDDIVSFIVGDTHAEVSDFLKGITPLCERGIATVACLRGNAAAGGVALAAACDVVLAARGVVLNPSYRGMGLHGSELHSFTYLKRCGPRHAATLLRAMKPLSSELAHTYGLVDVQVGSPSQTLSETEPVFIRSILDILRGTSDLVMFPCTPFRCAPWATYNSVQKGATPPRSSLPLVQFMCDNKALAHRYRDFPPLLHYRNEELSQMLLDCFHPIRSERYHSRRYKFIRKIKADSTPARYALHSADPATLDPEDTPEFDDAPGWQRGEEWNWVGLETPDSLKTSEKTRIDMWYRSPAATPRTISYASATSPASVASRLALQSPRSRRRSETDTEHDVGANHSNALGLHVDDSTPGSTSGAITVTTDTTTTVNTAYPADTSRQPGLTTTSSSSGSDTSMPRTPKESTSKLLALFGTILRSKDKPTKAASAQTRASAIEISERDGAGGEAKGWTTDEFGALGPGLGKRDSRRFSTFSKATGQGAKFDYEKDESRFRSIRKRVKSVFRGANISSYITTTTTTLRPTSSPVANREEMPPVPLVSAPPDSATSATSTPKKALKALRRLSLVSAPSSSSVKASPSSRLPLVETEHTVIITSTPAASASILASLEGAPNTTAPNRDGTIRQKRISPPSLMTLSPSGKETSAPHTPRSTNSTQSSAVRECEYPCLVNGGEEWESPRKAPAPPTVLKVEEA